MGGALPPGDIWQDLGPGNVPRYHTGSGENPGAAKQLTMCRTDPPEKKYVVQRLIAPSLRNPDLE